VVSDESGCADVPSEKSNGLEANPTSNHSVNCDSPIESHGLSNSETEEALLPDNSYEKLETDQEHAKKSVASVTEKLLEDEKYQKSPPNVDALRNDDTKESLFESSVMLNGETVNDDDEQIPCKSHNFSSEDGTVDDESKPSLEMFTSEVDAVDSGSTVQCGSLELLCENDDEVDCNSAKMSAEPRVAEEEVDINPSETSSVCHVTDVEVTMNPAEISTGTYVTNVAVAINPAEISTLTHVTNVDVTMNQTETSTISFALDAQSDMNIMHGLVESTTSTIVLESIQEHVERAQEIKIVSEISADTLMKVSAGLEVMKVCDEEIDSERTNESNTHHDEGTEQSCNKNVTTKVLVVEQLYEKSQNENVDITISNESDALGLTNIVNTESTLSVEKTADDADNHVVDVNELHCSSQNNISSGDNDATNNFVETAIPNMLNVLDGFDQFISEEECNGKGKGGKIPDNIMLNHLQQLIFNFAMQTLV